MGNPFNWLADRTGIHPSQIGHGIGNALDNNWTKGGLAAMLAATGVGAPLGAAIMGGAGVLGGAMHNGGGLRDAFTGGLQGAALGGAAGGAGQAIRGAFAPGSSAASASFGPGVGVVQQGAEGGLAAMPEAATGGGGFMDALKSVGSFAAHNPNAVGAGLQGLGKIGTMQSENALADAQRQRLLSQNASDDYDLQAKRNRDAALEPLRRALAGQLGQLQMNKYPIAQNPYARG